MKISKNSSDWRFWAFSKNNFNFTVFSLSAIFRYAYCNLFCFLGTHISKLSDYNQSLILSDQFLWKFFPRKLQIFFFEISSTCWLGTTNRGVSHVRILQFGLSLVPGLLLGQFINNSNTLISIRRAKIELENVFTPCFLSYRDLALECFDCIGAFFVIFTLNF